MTGGKGGDLEELVRAYFARQGFFALRGVNLRFENEKVTDIDVWLYGRHAASARVRTLVDVKNKRSPRAFERILWVRGLQLALGCDRAIVATTNNNPKIVQFAQRQGVAVLNKKFLDKLKGKIDTSRRLSVEQFSRSIEMYAESKVDGDWLERLRRAKSSLISHNGYQAFNSAISAFRFFGERADHRLQYREQARRCAYAAGALACIALDSALERTLYEDMTARYHGIANGVTYGDGGDGSVQSSVDRILQIISTGVDNGRAVSRQAKDALDELFKSIRADIIAEYFSRESNAAVLFKVGKELDERAHAVDNREMDLVSAEAKSVLGVFADFVQLERKVVFGDAGGLGEGREGYSVVSGEARGEGGVLGVEGESEVKKGQEEMRLVGTVKDK